MPFDVCNNEETINLEKYLNTFLQPCATKQQYPRQKCCGTSRSLYCTECCKLLIEREKWPLSIQSGVLDLPFALDIILSDRRLSATGFHALVLLRSSLAQVHEEGGNNCRVDSDDEGVARDKNEPRDLGGSISSFSAEERVRLFDTEIGETATIPMYDDQTTFVLFPSDHSIPISSAANAIERLVVLDCKWTKTGTQQNLPQISHLTQVHLDNPPTESFFWRWHNAGVGMCSTLEAIYYSALEVSKYRYQKFDEKKHAAIIDLMWLFGIQRAATALGARRDGKPLPFTKDGKDMQRDLRRTEKGSEKHMRDLENGRKLKLLAKAALPL